MLIIVFSNLFVYSALTVVKMCFVYNDHKSGVVFFIK